ncbi:MAG: DUF1549 domain-containing protein [Planctomycetaceae bacterium]
MIRAAWCIVLLAASGIAEAATLRVFPPGVHLSGGRDRQTLVAQLIEADGLTRDATGLMTISVEAPAMVRIDGRTLVPLADGDTAVSVAVGEQRVSVPVHVERAGIAPDPGFRLDVLPIFMRHGCNAGACHGSARGKDGFRLSLFGFDPDADHHRLTREQPGRRINLALPAESLLLTKATAAVPHTGGARLRSEGDDYATLKRWIETGARNDPAATPGVVAVEIHPPEAVLDGPGATQQFTVLAKYADGTDRDVTSLAVFLSGNDAAAKVDPAGLVTGGMRGEALVMARYETHTVGAPVITLPAGLPFEWTAPPPAGRIDELVEAKLRKLRLTPSELCTDEEFLRRASIDVCGVLPTSDEYHSFVASPDPDKRGHLVDQLLARKEFVDLWVMKWSELLMIRTVPNQVSEKGMHLYHAWLEERIEANTPIDALVRELLAAEGGTFTAPATNYFQHERSTLKTAENVAQVFMGMRIQCAQCHNHPFDRWTMDDYYGFAAFFAQIGRKPGEDPREAVVFNAGSGDVKHPVGGRVVPPKFLGGAVAEVAGTDRRAVLAAWLTAAENPHFGRNLVNMVWAHFFGRGIVDEVDDVRVSNPPVNEALLAELSRGFVAAGYDFRSLIRDICTSRAYQRSTRPNATNAADDRTFSRASLRRIRAEVLLDVMTAATGTQNKFKGLPAGSRAVQIADGNTSTYFLTTFGRATRATACSCEVKMEPNLSQALHLLNGDTVQQKIRQGRVVHNLLDAGRTPEQVIEELYLRTLTRKPTGAETAGLMEIIAAAPAADSSALREALEDGFWAILNSREFVFNH